MCIPIFIHHELYGGNISELNVLEYPIIALKQAQKYNKKVVLFGNQKNKDWWDDWINVEDYIREDWKEFEKGFVNLAIDYSEEYAKAFYRRLFVFYHYAAEHGIEDFFMADSDVLIYTNLSLDGRLAECNYAFCMKENPNLAGAPPDNNMAMACSIALSYWKTKDMGEFIQFIQDTYFYNRDVLLKKYSYHLQYDIPGGVCEMTLMYLWHQNVKDKKKFLNLLKYSSDYPVHDNGAHNTRNYLENEYLADEVTGNKKVVFKEGVPYFIRTENHELVQMASLHMVGGLKRYMSDVYKLTCKQLIKKDDFASRLQTELNKHLDIIIYGAGVYAKKVNIWLRKYNKRPKYFVVSESGFSECTMIDDIEVITFDELSKENDYLFIIGIQDKKAHDEVKNKLQKRNYNNILEMNLLMLGV